MEFKYPVAQKDGKEYKAEELYGLLAKENTGYYLLSVNQFWHGGVHFSDSNFSHCIRETPIQAIAEGTVIAYRINKDNLFIADDKVTVTPPNKAGYQYSSGFCLVKHQYKSPEKKPTAQENMEQWKDREIVLQSNRKARNIEGLTLKEDTDYELTLASGTKLEVVGVGNQVVDKYYFTQVKTKEALKGKTNAGKEVDVPAGTVLYLATFKADGTPATYKGTGGNQQDIFKENDTPEKWQDRLVILKTDTASYKDAEKANKLTTLPAGTKLQVLEASNKTGAATKAKLLYDINTNPDGEASILKKDQELWIDLFDDKGQVKQQDSKPIAEDTPTADKSQYNFTFYSLYMHLCCYNDYLAKPEEKEEDKTETITVTATNLTIRDKHRDEAHSKVIGKITTNATLEVIETKTSGEYTDIKGKILTGEVKNGTTVTAKKDDTVWVPSQKGTDTYTKVNAKPAPKEMTRPSYWEGTVTAKVRNAKGIKIWAKLENNELKEPIGDINLGNQFSFDSTQVKIITHNQKSTMVAECTPIGKLGFRGKGEHSGKFWTTVDKDSITREKVEPTSFDTVIACKAKITAGEALGYLGDYQTPSEKGEIVKKKQVHVEIFTPDPMMVDFLLNNPLGLKDGKQYIKLPAGTGLYNSPPAPANSTPAANPQQPASGANGAPPAANAPNQPNGAPQPANNPNQGNGQQPLPNAPAANAPAANGQPAANAQPQANPTASTTSRSSTPSYTLKREHIFAIDDITLEKDPDGTEWYRIGAEQHAGGVKKTENSPEVINQHEWKKLGFQEVKETNPSSDGYLDLKNMPAIFQDIYNKIDTNKDGKLQQSELKAALKDQEIRDQWSKLIAYHPSEWKKDTSPLFKRFEQLLTNEKIPEEKQADAKKLLEQEKERMTKLVFLEDVTPSIPVLLYHFHPVTFVEYMEDSGMPPWLKIAWQEHDTYKGVREMDEPLSSRIKEYFNQTNGKGWGHTSPWCAAFVNWCIIKSNYVNSTFYTAKAYEWGNRKQENKRWVGWPEGEIYKPEENSGKGKPYVGAIVVLNFSHCAFVIGKTKEGQIVLLGGNQKGPNSGSNGWYLNLTKVGMSKVLYFMKPKNYNVSSTLEDLPTLVIEGGELDHAGSR